MSFKEYIKFKSLEDIASDFGVSVPTVSRWKAEDKYPEFVNIILMQKEKIRILEDEINRVVSERDIIKNSLDEIKSFFKKLVL